MSDKRDLNDLKRQDKFDPQAFFEELRKAREPMSLDEITDAIDTLSKPKRKKKQDSEESKTGIGTALNTVMNAPEIAGSVRFNQFTLHVDVLQPLPWSLAVDKYPRPWIDVDDTELSAYLQNHYTISCAISNCADVIQAIAYRAPYHPVRDYLLACKSAWDGKPRVKTLFSRYFHALAPEEYTERISQAFLVSAVARIMKPGCKVDTVPVVDGPQGTRKSTAFAILFAPWFTDDLTTPGTKDAAEQLRGVWCVEFAELIQFSRAAMIENKAFISRTTDHYRPPYGRRTQDFPRQNVFVATTNIKAWQRDETGARRFWPLSVNTSIDTDAIARDKDQIWGEATDMFLAGVKWYFDEENTEPKHLAAAREEHREIDAYEKLIAEYINTRTSVTIQELLSECLDVKKDRWDRGIQMRVSAILKTLGWERYQRRSDEEKKEWAYRKPTTK